MLKLCTILNPKRTNKNTKNGETKNFRLQFFWPTGQPQNHIGQQVFGGRKTQWWNFRSWFRFLRVLNLPKMAQQTWIMRLKPKTVISDAFYFWWVGWSNYMNFPKFQTNIHAARQPGRSIYIYIIYTHIYIYIFLYTPTHTPTDNIFCTYTMYINIYIYVYIRFYVISNQYVSQVNHYCGVKPQPLCRKRKEECVAIFR